ncbi:hypothetical protein SNEBB_000844 [Seison nebaliae]|nr:hypothetical protein SNEBB_000844 [Seison nebaliae]
MPQTNLSLLEQKSPDQMFSMAQSIGIDVTELKNMMKTKTGKIPRPMNAFMVFAHQHRSILRYQNPKDCNNDVSKRLGALWKNLPLNIKQKYYHLQQMLHDEHKKMYPDYTYNPRDAAARKKAKNLSSKKTTVKNEQAQFGEKLLDTKPSLTPSYIPMALENNPFAYIPPPYSHQYVSALHMENEVINNYHHHHHHHHHHMPSLTTLTNVGNKQTLSDTKLNDEVTSSKRARKIDDDSY